MNVETTEAKVCKLDDKMQESRWNTEKASVQRFFRQASSGNLSRLA